MAVACVTALAQACLPDNSIGADAVSGEAATNRGGSGGAAGTYGSVITGGGAGATTGGSGTAGGAAGGGGAAVVGTAGGAGAGGSTGGAGGATTPDAGASSAGGGGTRAEGGAPVGMTGAPGVIAAGGPSKCPLAGAALCDGFENAAPGAATSMWASEPKGATTIVADTSKPYRGTKSVHIAFDKAASAQGFITQTATLAAGKNAMWGRMFVWYQVGAGQVGPAGHFVFIRLEGTPGAGQPTAASQLHLMGGTRATLATEIRTTSDVYKTSAPPIAVPPTPARWQCWEWHTTNENTADIYIDGKLVPGLSVTATDKWVFPVMSKMYLGYLDFIAGPSGDMWIDEVAIGDTQIGCDP